MFQRLQVILCPFVRQDGSNILLSKRTWAKRAWCRLERLASQLHVDHTGPKLRDHGVHWFHLLSSFEASLRVGLCQPCDASRWEHLHHWGSQRQAPILDQPIWATTAPKTGSWFSYDSSWMQLQQFRGFFFPDLCVYVLFVASVQSDLAFSTACSWSEEYCRDPVGEGNFTINTDRTVAAAVLQSMFTKQMRWHLQREKFHRGLA